MPRVFWPSRSHVRPLASNKTTPLPTVTTRRANIEASSAQTCKGLTTRPVRSFPDSPLDLGRKMRKHHYSSTPQMNLGKRTMAKNTNVRSPTFTPFKDQDEHLARVISPSLP